VRNIIAIIFIIFLIFLIFPIAGFAEEIEVLDSAGRRVKVPKEPQRIIPLSYASAELVRLMGAMDRVVGTTSYIRQRIALIPEAQNIPDLGRAFSPNMEELIRLEPDLVLAWATNPGPELDNRLDDLGIKLLRLDFYLSNAFSDEARVLAEVLGGEAKGRAESYLAWIDKLKKDAEELIREANPPRPTVLMEHFSERKILGPGSGSYQLGEMAFIKNLAEPLGKEFSVLDEEWIIKQNPDVYVKVTSFPAESKPGDNEKLAEAARLEVMSRRGWEDMKAVKSGRVYVFDTEMAGGPRYILGLYLLCHFFYPDLYPMASYEGLRDEYLKVFQGLNP
jgi:iron complex transport system substrate-binding protein